VAGHFSRYAGGLPGTGLLILRASVGVSAILHGWASIPGHESGSLRLWSFAAVLCLGGAALTAGVLTVFAGAAVGIAELVTASSLLPFPTNLLAHSQAASALVILMTISVILIGPGAFSIDSRLFGLREVRIPPVSPPSDL
jgi:uncharacterized membrane protein YphA (DoxX/SURF4 family)